MLSGNIPIYETPNIQLSSIHLSKYIMLLIIRVVSPYSPNFTPGGKNSAISFPYEIKSRATVEEMCE